MENVTYKSRVKIRKSFLTKHKEEDFVYLPMQSDLLISVPHGVMQTRLGKLKFQETGTVALGLILAEKLNSSYIIKTKHNFDDVNFDTHSNYKDKIKYLISACGVKYIIDLHGMKKSRDCDVNLGINFGRNIKNNETLFNNLEKSLKAAGFNVEVDNPFMAPERTIAGYFSKELNVWTIQIEINCALTNESENNEKIKKFLQTLIMVLKNR